MPSPAGHVKFPRATIVIFRKPLRKSFSLIDGCCSNFKWNNFSKTLHLFFFHFWHGFVKHVFRARYADLPTNFSKSAEIDVFVAAKSNAPSKHWNVLPSNTTGCAENREKPLSYSCLYWILCNVRGSKNRYTNARCLYSCGEPIAFHFSFMLGRFAWKTDVFFNASIGSMLKIWQSRIATIIPARPCPPRQCMYILCAEDSREIMFEICVIKTDSSSQSWGTPWSFIGKVIFVQSWRTLYGSIRLSSGRVRFTKYRTPILCKSSTSR